MYLEKINSPKDVKKLSLPELNSNFIIIVNDNEIAIAENHGGL